MDVESFIGDLLPAQPANPKWRRRGHGLVIREALEPEDVETLAAAPNLRILYLERAMPEGTWRLLNDGLFARRPEVCLMLCNWGKPRDDFARLDLLDRLPNLRDLSISGVPVKDAGALARHPGLLALGLNGRFSRKVTAEFLAAHPGLRRLGLGSLGFVPRGFERIADLKHLEWFSAGQGLPTLSFLTGLAKLREVVVFLAGNHDMASLGRCPALRELTLARVRKLFDLTGLGESRSLRKLRLDELRNVTSVSFAGSIPTLESLWMVQLKRLSSLDGVAGHAGLVELALYGGHRLTDDEVVRLGTCPRLKRLFGVFRKPVEDAIRRALPECRVNPR